MRLDGVLGRVIEESEIKRNNERRVVKRKMKKERKKSESQVGAAVQQ